MKPYHIKIGGRIYKIVFAVFVCFLIDTIRNTGVYVLCRDSSYSLYTAESKR